MQKTINMQLYISNKAFIRSVVWHWWLPNDIYFNNQSPRWKTILFVETTKFSSNSVRVYIQLWNFLTLCPRGGAFDSLFCPEGRVFVHKNCPGGRVLLPSSRVLGVCPTGDCFGWNWCLHKPPKTSPSHLETTWVYITIHLWLPTACGVT